MATPTLGMYMFVERGLGVTSPMVINIEQHYEISNALAMGDTTVMQWKGNLSVKNLWNPFFGSTGDNKNDHGVRLNSLALEIPQTFIVRFNSIHFQLFYILIDTVLLHEFYMLLHVTPIYSRYWSDKLWLIKDIWNSHAFFSEFMIQILKTNNKERIKPHLCTCLVHSRFMYKI